MWQAALILLTSISVGPLQIEVYWNFEFFKCRCCAYVKARKQLSVHEVPNILTVVLKRFQVIFFCWISCFILISNCTVCNVQQTFFLLILGNIDLKWYKITWCCYALLLTPNCNWAPIMNPFLHLECVWSNFENLGWYYTQNCLNSCIEIISFVMKIVLPYLPFQIFTRL